MKLNNFSVSQMAPRLNRISIKWRLFIYLAMFAAATLLLLWMFQVVFLQSFYKSIKINTIKKSADVIIKNVDNDDLETLVTRVAQSNEVCIIIANEDAEKLYSADAIPDCVIHHLPTIEFEKLLQKAQNSGGTYYERFNRESFRDQQYRKDNFVGRLPLDDRGMTESILYVRTAEQKSGEKLMIVLNANISAVDATVQTIRSQLFYVTIIMLVLALLLALFISKRISKPIIRINSSAKELAKGNYDVLFNENGYKEIAELGSTLNYAAKELVKTENLRRDLIANISHDLRTPLTMITGYAEVMRDIPNENTPENVQIIIDEATRLTTLVNDVLDISKLQSGAVEPVLSEFSLTSGIRQIMNRYSKLTEQEGYTIRFLFDRDVRVWGDELRISQVVYNLVNNAITYTGKDKSVIVRQITTEKKVRIEVIDTGDGIPPEKLKDIWERYYKLGKKHTRAQIGTGLGLSIVKAILEQHNAAFGVQSTLGQGSVFWFEMDIL